jgi:thiamine-phosphate pyrophosphorylase
MPLNPQEPIIYLITSGATGASTTPASEDFRQLLKLVEAAVAANVNLLQIREKNLNARVLYELATQAAEITRASSTRLLVNDRADIARAARADGVHLTTKSITASVIRRTFGDHFLIGVSTHSLEEAREAYHGGADFAVFGPVFDTTSKRMYGEPPGIRVLEGVAVQLAPFPILALGGVTRDNVADCFRAGASGIAAIRLLNHPAELSKVLDAIREAFGERQQ